MRQAGRKPNGATLAARMLKRRAEIEQAALARVYSISEPPSGDGGAEYADGLRAAVSAGIDYALAGIERGEENAPPIPDASLAQARLAARAGVSLDTVLRRYVAGHVLVNDFMVAEADREERFGPAELKRLLRSEGVIADRLLAAVSRTYAEEIERRPTGAIRRSTELVERLLGGEPLDTAELSYDFGGWHVGIVASGPPADEAIREVASSFDCRLLSVRREEGVLWAWLGSRRRLDQDALRALASRGLPTGLALALGEPGKGIAGWRLSHMQARAALPIALRSQGRPVRYDEVALEASMSRDDLLVTSLREIYLKPLAVGRDGGALARRTLMAYFATERSVSSAAAMLGVSRQTVSRRLRAIEARIERPLSSCATEVEAALRLGARRPAH